MRALIFFALLGVALAGTRGSRIVGGVETTVDEYPFIVNMEYYWITIYYRYKCGGSLLTSRTVLSAASCFYEYSPVEWRARVGSSSASQGGTAHAVGRFQFHEGYNSVTKENDIAIVHLATSVEFSDKVRVARIASNNYVMRDGTYVTALGWGAFWFGGNLGDGLYKVDTQIINQQTCAQRYALLADYPNVSEGMICTGILDVGGKDACEFDEGAPIVHNNDVVVAFRSWSYDCAHPYYPGVNTRISYYSDWIVQNGST